jgi:hypothetical protein
LGLSLAFASCAVLRCSCDFCGFGDDRAGRFVLYSRFTVQPCAVATSHKNAGEQYGHKRATPNHLGNFLNTKSGKNTTLTNNDTKLIFQIMLVPLGSLRFLLVPMLLGNLARLDGMPSTLVYLLARRASLPNLIQIVNGLG